VRVVSFKIEEEVLEALDILAREKRVPRSELVRRAIHMLLSQYTKPYASKRIRVY